MELAHTQHCRPCKERIGELLTAIYSSCRTNHSFPWPAEPQAYTGTVIGETLQRVRSGLAKLRGHNEFIKSLQVPPCDYYVSDPPFVLEFDESQHFTLPRLAALSLYPTHLKLGFPLLRWQELCRELNAVDNDPLDRDERRAWYDTLRDLVPLVHGFRPTVRLYAAEYAWCSLDAASQGHRQEFAVVLAERSPEAGALLSRGSSR
jgi:hypothetical protein